MRAREIISEQPVDSIQSNIVQKVQSIFDINELNKIYSYIRKVDIGQGFDQVFAEDEDLRQVQSVLSRAIIESEGSFDEKMGFAQELVNPGIINIKKLLSPGTQQSINDVVVTKYPGIFQSVVPELLNIAGNFVVRNTKTQRGKGEFFLALCSPQINLSNKGDLEINGSPIEVKGNLARIKGRKGYGTTDTALAKLKKQVEQFVSKVPQLSSKEYTVGLGQKSTLWSQFGPDCQQAGVDFAAVLNLLRSGLKSVVKSLYLDLSSRTLESFADTIDANGVLNWSAFVPLTKVTAFEYYQAADKFSGILFINSDQLVVSYVDNAQVFNNTIRLAKLGFEQGQQNGLQIKF